MANKIYITLQVDDKGTATLKKFGGNADAAFKKMKVNANAGAAQAGKMEKAWSGAVKKMKMHWKAYSAAAAVAMTAVAVAVGAGIKKVIGIYADFEKEMANVSTLVDTSKVSMQGLERGIMKLPAALGSATELTKGLYQALSAGVKPAQAIEFVGKAAMAAKAGLSDTFTAVDAGTTILNAFGMEASKAGEVYDLMFTTVKEGKTTFGELSGAIGKISPIAAAANVSVVEMHAALATLTKGGFKTSEASARLATALGTIIKPSSEAVKLTEKLGLEFNATALKTKGLHGFLQDVKKATGGNVEQMAQLFGGMESLSVMLALTGKQSQEFTDILGRMGNASGATEEAFKKQKKTLGALWDTFKNFAGKQAILFGGELAPYLKDVLNTTMAWCEANRDLIAQKIPEYVGKIADSVSAVAKTISFLSGIAIPGSMGIIGLYLFGPVGGAIALALGLIIKNIQDFDKNFGSLAKKMRSGNMEVMDSFNMLGADASYMYETIANAGNKSAKDQEADFANLERVATGVTKTAATKIKDIWLIHAQDMGRIRNKETAAELKRIKDSQKAAVKAAKEREKLAADFSKKYQKLTLGNYDYAVRKIRDQGNAYERAGSDHVQVEEWVAAEIKDLADKGSQDKIKATEDFSDKYQELTLGDYDYAVRKIRDQGNAYERAGSDHVQVEKWVSAEIGKLVDSQSQDKIKADEDYAKESTRIYERLVDDVNKNALSEYQYKGNLLDKQYSEYKNHLVSLGRQNETYADGVNLLDTWLAGEKAKLWDEEARKHGGVLDTMKVAWSDFSRDNMNTSQTMYDGWTQIMTGMKSSMTDILVAGMKGDWDEMASSWESLWDNMLDIVIRTVAAMLVQAAAVAAIGFVTEIVGGLFAAKGIWEVPKGKGQDTIPVWTRPGEMILTPEMGEKIRAGVAEGGYSGDFGGLGEAMRASTGVQDTAVMEALAKGTAQTYSIIGGAGLGLNLSGLISGSKFAEVMMSPEVLGTSILTGGVPAVGREILGVANMPGIEGMPGDFGWDDIGALLGYVGLATLGVPGVIAGIVGQTLGAYLGDYFGDAIDMRQNEPMLDAYEDVYSSRRNAHAAAMASIATGLSIHSYPGLYSPMQQAIGGYYGVDPGSVSPGLGYASAATYGPGFAGFGMETSPGFESGAYSDPNWGGGGDGLSSGGFGGFGGLGEGLGSTGGWGGDDGDDGGFWKYGGIARGPASGHRETLHGDEAVVPLSGGRSIPVEMRGGGPGGGTTIHLNGPLVSIEGDNHVFDDQFIEKLTREVRIELRNLEELRH